MIDADEDDAEGEVIRDEETNTESTGDPPLSVTILYTP